MKVLIDTSVWSHLLRHHQPVAKYRKTLAALIEKNDALLLGVVHLELLSGIKYREQFSKIQRYLQNFFHLKVQRRDYEVAAEFFNTCMAGGVRGSHIDFLICAVAVRRKLLIFSADKDFDLYQKFLPINLLKIQS